MRRRRQGHGGRHPKRPWAVPSVTPADVPAQGPWDPMVGYDELPKAIRAFMDGASVMYLTRWVVDAVDMHRADPGRVLAQLYNFERQATAAYRQEIRDAIRNAANSFRSTNIRLSQPDRGLGIIAPGDDDLGPGDADRVSRIVGRW